MSNAPWGIRILVLQRMALDAYDPIVIEDPSQLDYSSHECWGNVQGSRSCAGPLGLHLVFIAARGCLITLASVESTGSEGAWASAIVAYGLSCLAAWWYFHPGINLCLLHRQADS